MLGHLIRKEILDHITSLRFIILTSIGVVVIWLSLYDGYAYYRDCLREYRLAQVAGEERIQQLMDEGKVSDNAWGAWEEIHSGGYLIHKPPTAMSVFVRGLEPTLGRSMNGGRVTEVGGDWLTWSPAASDPILGIFPVLDLGMAVQVVLSLFVLLLTYDAVCGEKEGGTLRLIGSFPVPRDHLLVAKLVGALFPTLTAVGLPLLLGLALIQFAPEVKLSAPEWVRLGLVVLTFAVYLTTFTCLGLMASALVSRSATAFVILLGFWIVMVAILPRISLIAADRIRPAPSLNELVTKKAAIGTDMLQKRDDLQEKWSEAYKERTGKESWESPEGREEYYLYYMENRVKAGETLRKMRVRLDEAFSNAYRARTALAVMLARLSPPFLVNHATVRLAGTGEDRHQRFLDVRERYRETRGTFVVKTKNRDVLRMDHPEKYGPYVWDISDLPRFVYRDIWPDEDVRAAMVDIGVLGFWCLLFFTGAYVSVRRYDLR